MRGPFSAPEFARLTGFSPTDLERYREHGLLDLDGDGVFDDYDLLRAWYLVKRHPELEPEELARGLEEGRLGDHLTDMLFQGAGTGHTIEEAASRIGIGPDRVGALLTALGIGGVLDEDDIEHLTALKQVMEAGLPWEALLEGARVMGETLGRLADAECRLFHFHVHERLRQEGVDGRELMDAVQGSAEAMLGVLENAIRYVHEKHLLRANAEDIVLFHLDEKPPEAVPGSMEAAVVFVDLASFTSVAFEAGDVAAADLLDRFAEVVRELALAHRGSLVKQLGDGFMLTFPDPMDAARFGEALIDAARRQEGSPPLRIGLNFGPLLYRAGDYVGNTVNLASRLGAMAMPNEILMTESVAAAASRAGLAVESAGVRDVRGASEAIPMFRMTRGGEEERDPVCGVQLSADPAARLMSEGRQLAFCSERCLRRFLDEPSHYLARTS